MESSRFDLGERSDQVRRRHAFNGGEPFHFGQEFGIGEACERIVRRHVPVYHDAFRPTTMAMEQRALADDSFFEERSSTFTLRSTSSVYAACWCSFGISRAVLAGRCQAESEFASRIFRREACGSRLPST